MDASLKTLLEEVRRGEADALDRLAEVLVDDPPEDDSAAMQLAAPLFQERRAEAAALFPRLFGALAHPSVAAPVLDLANFLTREKVVPKHPGSDIARQLAALLGEVVQSLQVL